MSKLTHSTDEGMRQIDERHAREDGEPAIQEHLRDGIDSDTARMMVAVDKRHERLADLTRQFMAAGLSNTEANQRAFMMVKAGLKPKVDEGEYRAREVAKVQAWKRVYQGGHHDVWCDGKTHKRTYGGFCHPDNPAGFNDPGHEFKCNCAYYRRETLNDAAPDMLAALKAAQEALFWYKAENFEFENPGVKVGDQVAAAIAKATGGNHD